MLKYINIFPYLSEMVGFEFSDNLKENFNSIVVLEIENEKIIDIDYSKTIFRKE